MSVCYPPLPHFWAEVILKGVGGGVYILKPPAAGFLYTPAPSFIRPPPFSEGTFRGWGVPGGGVCRIWPHLVFESLRAIIRQFLSISRLSWERGGGGKLVSLHELLVNTRQIILRFGQSY